jgi:hypothetical protein
LRRPFTRPSSIVAGTNTDSLKVHVDDAASLTTQSTASAPSHSPQPSLSAMRRNLKARKPALFVYHQRMDQPPIERRSGPLPFADPGTDWGAELFQAADTIDAKARDRFSKASRDLIAARARHERTARAAPFSLRRLFRSEQKLARDVDRYHARNRMQLALHQTASVTRAQAQRVQRAYRRYANLRDLPNGAADGDKLRTARRMLDADLNDLIGYKAELDRQIVRYREKIQAGLWGAGDAYKALRVYQSASATMGDALAAVQHRLQADAVQQLEMR